MTDENRGAHDAFCNPIIARLARDGPLEMQLANLIAQTHGRLILHKFGRGSASPVKASPAPSTRSIPARRRPMSPSPKP